MENALTGTGTARFHSERRHFGESRLKKTVSISPPSGRVEAFRQGSDGFSRYRDKSGCSFCGNKSGTVSAYAFTS